MPGETNLSRDEELKAALHFMGSIYGESRKLDESELDETKRLRQEKSNQVKQKVEELIRSQQQPPIPIPPTVPSPPHPQVSGPVREDAPLAIDNDQLEFNFNKSEKELLLDRIAIIESKLDKIIKLLTVDTDTEKY